MIFFSWKINWATTIINLQNTSLENKQFEPVVLEKDENDWIQCKLNESSFEGFGGPSNLEEIITVFKNWVEFELI
ncbi:Imm53 family immunity protein [Gorillibacterium sp. sgz5001074]|uniref:Imm53 family immunity protein n=1 Tax=Gorillibacterium sp. sgz5001074 TaxID=3446695 RepID=UPI003F67C11E